jgi:hypothetical protein
MPTLIPGNNAPAADIEPSGKRGMTAAVFAQTMRHERNAAGIRERPLVQVQPRAVAGMHHG